MKRHVATTWPRTVAVGGTKVRVYRRKRSDGGHSYEVADYSTGKRKLRSFADPTEALETAGRIAQFLAAGDSAAAQVSARELAGYGRAVELLRPTAVPLELAATVFAEAHRILGSGERILEACRYFADRDPSRLTPKTVAEAAAELVAMKQARGKSRRYIEDLRARLAKLSAAFQTQVSSVRGADVQAWLDGMTAAPGTVRNFRRVAFTLFQYCETRGLIMKGSNPVADTERVEGAVGAVTIYTAPEIARLLAAASPDFLPALALSAFAGLRSAEIERLDWADVDLPGRFITVSPEQAKTKSRRLVPIADNLAAWLAPHARKAGKVWRGSHRDFYHAQEAAARAAGIAWKPNACRHSFASCRLAQTQDAARVALEMGNSPAVVFRHYRELTKPEQAERWFSVTPDAPANVVPLEANA